MPPFIYIPRVRAITPELLQQLGLAELGGGYARFDVLSSGPDGGAGQCIYWHVRGRPLPNLNTYPDWEWTPAVPDPDRDLAAGRYWMGRVAEQPIEPADLVRPRPFAGVPAALDDGQLWTVPVARQLPHRLRLDPETGQHTRHVREEYRAYFDLAMQFWRALVNIGSPIRKELHVSDAWSLACMGLALNYRLNRDLIDWLQLCTTDTALFGVACAAIELEAWVHLAEDQKKTLRLTPGT